MFDISRRIYLLLIFFGLLSSKFAGFNGIIDDGIMLVIGAMIMLAKDEKANDKKEKEEDRRTD